MHTHRTNADTHTLKKHIGCARFNVPPNTLHLIPGTGFYGSNDPTNSAKALKKDRVLRIRLQSHQVHLTALTVIQQLCSMKKNTKYEHINTKYLRTVKWAQCDKTRSREV